MAKDKFLSFSQAETKHWMMISFVFIVIGLMTVYPFQMNWDALNHALRSVSLQLWKLFIAFMLLLPISAFLLKKGRSILAKYICALGFSFLLYPVMLVMFGLPDLGFRTLIIQLSFQCFFVALNAHLGCIVTDKFKVYLKNGK